MVDGHRHRQSAAAGLLRRFFAWVAILAVLSASVGVPALPVHATTVAVEQDAAQTDKPPCSLHDNGSVAASDAPAANTMPGDDDCCEPDAPCDEETGCACGCSEAAVHVRLPLAVEPAVLAALRPEPIRHRRPTAVSGPAHRVAPQLRPPIKFLPRPSRA